MIKLLLLLFLLLEEVDCAMSTSRRWSRVDTLATSYESRSPHWSGLRKQLALGSLPRESNPSIDGGRLKMHFIRKSRSGKSIFFLIFLKALLSLLSGFCPPFTEVLRSTAISFPIDDHKVGVSRHAHANTLIKGKLRCSMCGRLGLLHKLLRGRDAGRHCRLSVWPCSQRSSHFRDVHSWFH